MSLQALLASALSLGLAVFSALGEAAPSDCHKVVSPSQRTFEYCVRPSTNPNAANVIYYFHGLGGSANDVFETFGDQLYGGLLQVLGSARMPHLVGISYGWETAFAPASFNDAAVPTQEIVDFTLPEIERGLKFPARPNRTALGLSLGGFNALGVVGERPADFTGMALLCPALLDLNPFDVGQVNDFMKRNSSILDPNAAGAAVAGLKTIFNNVSVWSVGEPFARVRQGRLSSMPIYVSIGTEDEYGFAEGAQSLVNVARAKGATVEWVPVPGRHCQFDPRTLAAFFAQTIH